MLRTSIAFTAALALAPPLAAAQSAPALPFDQAQRNTSIERLQDSLFDLLALRQAAHQAHWNVTGPDFHQAHEFYEGLYQSLNEPIDTFGARIRSLGGVVDARPSSVAENATVEVREPELADQATTAQALHDAWSQFSKSLYSRIRDVKDDMPTQDLLIGTVFAIDKQTWMLRAHLTE